MANASAHQCIQSAVNDLAERGEEGIGVINPEKIAKGDWQDATPDEYLRLKVPMGSLKDKENKEFKVMPCYKLGDKYFDAQGNEYSGDTLKFKEKGDALVAIVFRPNDDKSDVELVGVWPDESLGVGTTPLNGSCWTSIAPNSDISVNY